METKQEHKKTWSKHLFKSYYVVWKPIKIQVINTGGAAGLNRTMQYGNPTADISYDGFSSKFKSYYVVWKQDFKISVTANNVV